MRYVVPGVHLAASHAATLMLTITLAACTSAANPAPAKPAPAALPATRQTEGTPLNRSERLLGEYGRYRANNDLLYYHLDVRLDPDKKFLSGKNTIRFRMLSDDDRIQIDLH